MFFRLSKFFLYVTVFAVAWVSTSTLFPFIVGKYTLFRLSTELALIFFLIGLALDPDAGRYWARVKSLFRHPLTWAVSAFALIFVVSGFFGVRPSFSFWSNFERGEGGFQMLHLYLYFLLLATLFDDLRSWKRYFICVLVAAGFMALYGLAAGLKFLDVTRDAAGNVTGGGPWFRTFRNFVGPGFGEDGYRFQGTIGNPAYVAGYLLFVFFDAAMLFILAAKKRSRIMIASAAAVLLVVFYFAGTRGAFLGLVGGALVALAYLAFAHKGWRRWILPVGGAILAIVASLIIFQDTQFVKSIPGSRIFDISIKENLGTGSEGTFSTRTIMWSIAWRAWQDRPILGFGPENFIWAFDRYFDPRYYDPAQGFGAWFDRAHSIFFDTLVSNGIVGFAAFVSIFVALGWVVWREPLRHVPGEPGKAAVVKGLMLALPAAYLVQGIVLFDVLTIYIGLFGFLGFAAFMTLPEVKAERFIPDGKAYGAVLGGLILAFIGMFYGTLLPYAKAVRYIEAESTVSSVTSVVQFEDHFNKVMKFPSPVGGEEIPKFLAGDILGVLPRIQGDSQTAHALVAYIEPYLWNNDIRHLLLKGQMYATLWQNYKSAEDFKKAEDTFITAHNIAPELPQPMMGLLALYTAAGDNAKRTEVIQKMASIWPMAMEAPTATKK